MDYKDILAMASAYKEVAEASAKTRALQSIKAQPKDKVSLAKAPWEKEKEVKKEALDPVDQKALKGKHKDRKDKDIDNDGDTDSSDEYLHKRRKAVSKAMKGKGKETEVEVQTQESVDLDESLAKHMSPYDAHDFLKKHDAHNKDFHTLPSRTVDAIHDKSKEVKYKKSRTAPGSTARMFHSALHKHANKYRKESVDLEEGAKEKALKALMTKALGGKRAKAGYTSYVGNNGDFVVYDGGGRIVGRLKAGEFQDPLKEEIEELDENKAIIKLYQDMKAQGKKDHNILDYIVSMPKYKRVSRDQMAKMIGDAKRKGIFKEEVELDIEEAKDHGNMNNGSPRGEGLSPSAKKELDRTTPMNPATDELAVNNLNFKTFKAMAKKAPKRSADNDAGDKKAIASATSVKEELDLLEFTQEEIIDFMMTEDFAQLDELSKKTLGSYVKKASKSAADNARAMRSADEPFHTYRATSDKYVKRIKGISKANDKLTKESFDLSDFTQEEIIDFIVTEDFAQLDELSKNTLSSYLKKAAKTKNATIDKADRIKYNNAGTGSEMAPRSKKALDKHNKTIDKRTKGIGSFMKRDQAKANPEYVHKPSATDRYKDGSAPSMTNKPASALHKSYKDRK